jgi:hypothetical protein
MREEQRARLKALLRRKEEIENEVEERVRNLQVAQKTCSKAMSLVLTARICELE